MPRYQPYKRLVGDWAVLDNRSGSYIGVFATFEMAEARSLELGGESPASNLPRFPTYSSEPFANALSGVMFKRPVI